MQNKNRLVSLLNELQQVLTEQKLWQQRSPDAKALSSQEPFALDCLTAAQWLQWIFIPKMRQMISQNAVLPSALHISPYLKEALACQGKEKILIITEQIDALFGNIKHD